MVTKSKLEYFWLILPMAFAAWSISRVWTVLPSIMGDEYVYTSAAKHLPFAEQYYSNYIFSSIMSLTNMCGYDFYTCTKSINSIFFVLAVAFTFLIAIRFLTFGWSVFVASVAALSPIAIPVSYFMPEIMYFSAMTAVVWVALWVSDRSKWPLWSLAGLALGVTALVKPHAIFMLPALTIFALLVSFKKSEQSKWLEGAKSASATIGGFVISKFGLGFAFAGPEGLKIFGGYDSPVGALTQVIQTSQPTVAQEQGSNASGLEVFLGVSSSHLVMHLAGVLLIAGLPLLLSLRVMWSVLRKNEPVGPVSSLFVLVGLITFSMIFVVAVFEAYVTVGGDDHSDRLILRYYEFLIPQFIIMGLLLPRFNDSKLAWRAVQGGLVIFASIFFSIVFPSFDQQYADSSTLPGLGSSGGLFIGLAVLISGVVLYWMFTPNEGNLIVGRFAIPLFLIAALALSQARLIEINGTPAYFDQAGWDSRSYLTEVPGERIIVIGQTRTEVFTVKFWIDDSGIKDLLVLDGSTITANDIPDSDYVVTLGNMVLDFQHEVVTSGEGYQLVKVVR